MEALVLAHEPLVRLAVVALDLAIYLQHVMFHAVPALWRLHRMHHADLDFDLTTGARFHPIEIGLSMLIKLALVVLIGAPALAVLALPFLGKVSEYAINHRQCAEPADAGVVRPDGPRAHAHAAGARGATTHA